MFPSYDVLANAAILERKLALQEGQRKMQLGVPEPGIGLPGWLRPLAARLFRRRSGTAPIATRLVRRPCRRLTARPMLRCPDCGAATVRRPARSCQAARRRRAAVKRPAVRG